MLVTPRVRLSQHVRMSDEEPKIFTADEYEEDNANINSTENHKGGDEKEMAALHGDSFFDGLRQFTGFVPPHELK